MVRPYSQDLRDRVRLAVDGGLPVRQAAPLFRVSIAYINRVMQRWRTSGDATAHRSGKAPARKLAAYEAVVRARLRETDATLAELQAWLAAEHGLQVSIGCLWTTLARWQITLKKSHSTPQSRRVQTLLRPASSGGQARLS